MSDVHAAHIFPFIFSSLICSVPVKHVKIFTVDAIAATMLLRFWVRIMLATKQSTNFVKKEKKTKQKNTYSGHANAHGVEGHESWKGNIRTANNGNDETNSRCDSVCAFGKLRIRIHIFTYTEWRNMCKREDDQLPGARKNGREKFKQMTTLNAGDDGWPGPGFSIHNSMSVTSIYFLFLNRPPPAPSS